MRPIATAIWLAAACGSLPRGTTTSAAAQPAPVHATSAVADAAPAAVEPQIDWEHVNLVTDDDARALWKRLAPTQSHPDILHAMPGEDAHKLALELLREGNFRCPPVGPLCSGVPQDMAEVADDAGLDDPCFRREVAVWAIDWLEVDDMRTMRDPLGAILDIPAPEIELPATLLNKVRELGLAFDDQLPFIERAWKAGHRDAVNDVLSGLSPSELVQLYRVAHIDSALEMLPASDYRDVFLDAIKDEQLDTSTRATAISDLVDGVNTLGDDLHAALLAAARAKDCAVAGVAALALDRRGDHTSAPKWPHSPKLDVMMRSLCVLAAYEHDQRSDEPSYLPGYIATSGFTLTHTIYDPYVDPPDRRAVDHLAAAQAVLPELDDLVVAMRHCQGTVCRSDRREFHFGFSRGAGGLLLSSIEVVDLPPC